jgi:hypothetical protein
MRESKNIGYSRPAASIANQIMGIPLRILSFEEVIGHGKRQIRQRRKPWQRNGKRMQER